MFYDMNEFMGFFLVVVRIVSFLAVAPFFSMNTINRQVKVFFGFMIALVVFPSIDVGQLPLDNLFAYSMLVMSETTVGLVIGLSSTFMFNAFRIAGQLIDLQIGTAMAQIFDPSQGSQNTILGQIFNLMALLIFLGLNGHHSLILALIKSFQLVPLSEGKITGGVIGQLLLTFTEMLVVAIQIAAPVIAVLIIIDICLGMVGKTVPQINVFMTGFPLKIGLGLLTIAFILPLMVSASEFVFNQIEKDLIMLLRSMA